MTNPKPTPAQVLAIPMLPEYNGAEATTIREYLASLLAALWLERDGFSGKRPFGSSIWWVELYSELGRAGLIAASFDEDGGLDDCDDEAGKRLILEAITALAQEVAPDGR